MPRALISTLLIAGVFYAPFAPLANAQEVASTTETTVATTTELIIELKTTQASTTASTTEVVTATESAPAALPTGVLLDNSYSDIPWSIQVYDGAGGYPGHYGYYFTGVRSVGNPPVLSPETAWFTTGTTTTVRIKKISGPSCIDLAYLGTGGLGINDPLYRTYETDPRWTRAVDDYCDFQLYGEGIPPGTPLTAMYLGTYPETILAGSHSNTGISLNGLNDDPVSGGFAFQLCGIDGCSGGFGSSTPTATTTASTTPPGPQVSNVLFLPGIKGSRLYSDETRCGVVTCDNRLWDPLSNSDVEDLYLHPNGESVRQDVYVKDEDIIDSVLGKKYYQTFIEEMDELQASTTLDGGNFKWKPVAYDWRLSLDSLIVNGVERDGKIYYEEASSTPYIEQTLKQLAATSTTGKVTLVAHSNGGLVVKALLAKLGPEETARLVDKIIFIGVPQTGAPQALGALLFGDHEGLPKDNLPFLASRSAARGLAENSPMAYHLLPSQKYLQETQDPSHAILSFSGSVFYPNERTAYGTSIDTVTELDNFLLAAENGRNKPAPEDVNSANVLNSTLISYANSTHASLDTWVPPSSVSVYQIAGWGANTISGIDFYDEQKLIGITVGHKKQYRLSFVEDGDEVVPIPSALMMSTSTPNIERAWINLQKARAGLEKYDHANIFEIEDVRNYIFNLIRSEPVIATQIITSTQPREADARKKLIFQLHSPLTLGIYDGNGNHTGLNTDGSVNKNIPGAEYGEFGDVKYLIVPAGQPYQLVMHGQSDGSFSLDIQEQTGNTVTTSATLADLPTTASTIARLSITNGIADASPLQVDSDGNGSTDITTSVKIGETVNYVPKVLDSYPNSRRHSTSIKVDENPIPIISSTNKLSGTIPPTNPERYIQRDTQATQTIATLEDSEVIGEVATKTSAQSTQTASVYDAFVSIAYWLQTALYNIWTMLVNTFNFSSF